MRYITNSEITEFLACQKSHNYKYVKNRLWNDPPQAVELGIEVHDLIEKVYKKEKYDPLQYDTKALGLLERYKEEFGIDPNFASEQVYSTELYSDVAIRGKFDLVDVNNHVIIDVKTSASLKKVDDIVFSPQQRTYAWLFWKAHGVVPTSIFHNIRTVDPDHPRSKPPYAALISHTFSEESLVEWEKELYGIVDRMLNEELVNNPVRTFSFKCARCPYQRACLAGLDDPAMEDVYLSHDTLAGNPDQRYETQ